MKWFVRRERLIGATILLVGIAAASRAQKAAPPDLEAAYNQAMMEFQSSNYAKAATELEALVARVEVTLQFEPIFYTIGSAPAIIRRQSQLSKLTRQNFQEARTPAGPPSKV